MNLNFLNHSLLEEFSLNLVEVIKWAVLDELSSDQSKDWLKANGNRINI
jgi:hypothetical protein